MPRCLPLLVGFYAKGVDGHGECAIAADGEDEVHALALVEVLRERRPCRVGDLRLVFEFVDGGRTARSSSSTASPRWMPSMSSSLRPASRAHADVVAPLVLAVAPMRDAQHRQLAQPGGQRRAEQQVVVEAQEGLGQLRDGGRASRADCPPPPGCGARRAACPTARDRQRRPTGPRGAGAHAPGASSRSRESDSHIWPIDFHLSRRWSIPAGQMCRSAGCHLGSNGAARRPCERFRTLILAAREDSFLR